MEDNNRIVDMAIQEAKEGSSVFRDKSLVSVGEIPDEDSIVGRTDQIETVATHLTDIFLNEPVNNLQIFGKTGTGKSLVSRYVAQKIVQEANEDIEGNSEGASGSKGGSRVAGIYINCLEYTTPTKVTRQIYKTLVDDSNAVTHLPPVPEDDILPDRGVSASQYLEESRNLMDERYQAVIIILDEIESLKDLNDLLYPLTRLPETQDVSCDIPLVLVSNKSKEFVESVDERTKSTLGSDRLIFPPYSQSELQGILEHRQGAFKEGALQEGVIEAVADYAADEHGDARKAIDLIRNAGELADKRGATQVTVDDVESARDWAEADMIEEVIQQLPLQQTLITYSVVRAIRNEDGDETSMQTLWEEYKNVAHELNENVLSYNRVLRYLSDIEFNEIISTYQKGHGFAKGTEQYCELRNTPQITLAAVLRSEPRLIELEDVDQVDEVLV